MSITPSLAQFLAIQARSLLHSKAPKSEDRVLLDKTFLKLQSLAKVGELKLDAEQSIDLVLLFPGDAKELLSKGDVISLRSLQAAAMSLSDSFSKVPQNREDIWRLRVRTVCLEALLHSTTVEVTKVLAEKTIFLDEVLSCYNGLNSASKILGGGKWNLIDLDPEPWKIHLLKSKLSILAILNRYFSVLSSHSDTDKFIEGSYKLVGDSQDDRYSNTPFVDCKLVSDLERMYHLTRMLRTIGQKSDDPRIDVIVEMINSSSDTQDPLGGLKLLPKPRMRPQTANDSQSVTPAPQNKGKGKGNDFSNLEIDTITQSQIQEIQSILPDIPEETIQIYLLDPRYSRDITRVMDALLDGYTPQPEIKVVEQAKQNHSGNYIEERRNVFENDALDLSKLRIGKQAVGASEIDHAMKLEILRRVEEMSLTDGENVDNESGASDIESIDSFEAVAPRVADGEKSSDEELEVVIKTVDNKLSTKNIETVLELAYLNDQSLFNRDSATRRGKERVELRKKTGCSDEQIEGWRIMLERNPNKEKILGKHEFSGNKPQPDVQQDSGSANRGRGGHRGRGAGRGDGSGSSLRNSQQDKSQRGRDERFKARQANHNRKRGHDKKMARGGLPSA